MPSVRRVVLNRGWPTSPGGINTFLGGASSYPLYNMNSLISKFTNKYICFYNVKPRTIT